MTENYALCRDSINVDPTDLGTSLVLKLKSRGMNAPELAVGGGAMGFWAALEEVYGAIRQQLCWMT